MTSHFNFTITQEDIDNFKKKLAKINYNPTPDPDNWFIKMWLAKAKGEMIDTLAVHGNAYTKIGDKGLEITGVWIDDALGVEERLHTKLKALDAPKKQNKPKHKVPFWAKDWRNK